MTVRSVFDTKAASFDPAEAAILSAAFDDATQRVACGRRLPANTEARLAKVIVNIARDRLRQALPLDAEAIAVEGAALVSQLRALSLLD